MRVTLIGLLVLSQIIYFGVAARRGSRSLSSLDDDIGPRSFLVNSKRRWPKGIVPYQIDSTFSPEQVTMIKENFKSIESISCVKWVPRTNQNDYVKINHHTTSDICSSSVGRKGGRQTFLLGDDCFNVDLGYQGAILHEMMHTLGFIHEHQRMDRDCYVRVANTAAEKAPYDFAITLETSTSFPYDFKSIMHYKKSHKLESVSGDDIGNQSGQLTELDIMKLNNLYCGGKTYCQLNPTDCRNIKEAAKKCKIKPGTNGIFVVQREKAQKVPKSF